MTITVDRSAADHTLTVAEQCKQDLGDPALWIERGSMRNSLALCIIDAIQSTRSQYSSVAKIVERYAAYRAGLGSDALADNATDLIRSFDDLGGPAEWADAIGNMRPVSTVPGAPLKAAAILQAAKVFTTNNIETAEQLRDVVDLGPIREQWTAIPGQKSGLTWSYLTMLTDVPLETPDLLVVRYLGRATATIKLAPADAAAILRDVAERCGYDSDRLAYTIWRFESGRPVVQQVQEE